MGVPGFFAWLLKNKKKIGVNNLILNELPENIKWLMLDTNCLLHPCVANILEKYKEGKLLIDENKDLRKQIENYIWEKIKLCINDMIIKTKPEYIFIAIDGVAPMGKILQQRQRRYRFLFDKEIKLNTLENNLIINNSIKTNLLDNGIEEPILPLSSIELTPGTDYMERINILMIKYLKELKKKNIKCIYSSYHEEGEGEHKILQYIKKNINSSESIIIYGLDADLLFLSLGIGYNYNLYVMREKQIFDNKKVDLDETPEYNYVEIKQLHKLINNLEISTNDFIILCYLIGNDFLPGLLTTDVKKGGLDKIIKAWNNLKEKKGLTLEFDNNNQIKSYLVIWNEEIKRFKVNLILLRGLFEELIWTEKYIWKNMNRDKFINQNDLDSDEKEKIVNLKQEEKLINLDKFINGLTNNTDFLEKIEFSSSIEYYSYYLGINCIDIDKVIIIKMVNDYIGGIEWCIEYYLNECPNWKLSYNFMVTPLIKDIINYFPREVNIIKEKRTLNPVEQLILAIPPETYKYVIEKELVDKVHKNKNIGYMIPKSFDIDINKENIYWKCQVKIPIVEYNEYDNEIKKLDILNDKNIINNYIKNY